MNVLSSLPIKQEGIELCIFQISMPMWTQELDEIGGS